MTNQIRHRRGALILLVASSAAVFAGRGLQHLMWDAPYRELLWDSSLFRPLVEFFDVSWTHYVKNLSFDEGIDLFGWCVGWMFLALALMSLGSLRLHQNAKRVLFGALHLGGAWLGVLALLYFKSKGYQLGQLIEYAAQVASPFLLWRVLSGQRVSENAWAVIVSFTFLGHGLYAIGYHPQPGDFVDMTLGILGVSEQGARAFLRMAGVFDLVVAAGVFVPSTRRPLLLAACSWGFITAFARVGAYLDFSLWQDTLRYCLPEMLYRLPHGLVPLVFWLSLKSEQGQRSDFLNRSTPPILEA